MTKRCPVEYQIAINSNIYLSKQSRSVILNWASLLYCARTTYSNLAPFNLFITADIFLQFYLSHKNCNNLWPLKVNAQRFYTLLVVITLKHITMMKKWTNILFFFCCCLTFLFPTGIPTCVRDQDEYMAKLNKKLQDEKSGTCTFVYSCEGNVLVGSRL